MTLHFYAELSNDTLHPLALLYIICLLVLIKYPVAVLLHVVHVVLCHFLIAVYWHLNPCQLSSHVRDVGGLVFTVLPAGQFLKNEWEKSEYRLCKPNQLTFSKFPALFVFHFQHASPLRLVGLGHNFVF